MQTQHGMNANICLMHEKWHVWARARVHRKLKHEIMHKKQTNKQLLNYSRKRQNDLMCILKCDLHFWWIEGMSKLGQKLMVNEDRVCITRATDGPAINRHLISADLRLIVMILFISIEDHCEHRTHSPGRNDKFGSRFTVTALALANVCVFIYGKLQNPLIW